MKNIDKKYLLIVAGFIVGTIAIVFLIIERETGTKTGTIDIAPTIVPTTSFLVQKMTPPDKAIDIFPGEIQISFTSDVPINSSKDFTFYLSPPPEAAPKLTSSFPTKTVIYQVLGGLEKNTEYTVIVSNKHSQNVAIWSFKTSNEQPESSSALAAEEQEKLNNSYYPLFDDVPYENANFRIDYTDRLALLVEIKKDNIEGIKKEVLKWIQDKGVNPSSHTITFQNKF